MSTVARIRELLVAAFAPVELEIEDDSASHAGHAGAASGGGHYNVAIVADAFAGKSRIERHRMVNAALNELMGTNIHALSIRARSADEARAHNLQKEQR